MDCVNHSGVTATAYCQNCGRGLCATCVRNGAQGQILCEPCATAWQSVPNPFTPFAAPPPGAPNPSAAAVLGLIPGVGAMYNGQFFKGFIHVVIFAVLISISSHYPIFGLFIAAWVLYQSFEAYHTARARRDGTPLPDPLGLNEVGNWLNLGARPHDPSQGVGPAAGPGAAAAGPGAYQAPYQAPYPGATGTPGQAGNQAPPWTPVGGQVDPNMPPVPPVCPPFYWRRKEPIGAIILIGLGIMFLLGQLDLFNGRFWDFIWPLFLIGLGVWLVLNRVGPWHGGPK